MTKPTAKDKVLKVWPDAIITSHRTGFFIWPNECFKGFGTGEGSLGNGYLPADAWESAAANLKKGTK
jgi:hypothetical protein